MDFDAFLAAAVAGSVTLAAFLFLPGVTEDVPDIIRTGVVYLVAVLLFSGGIQLWRRLRHRRR